MRQRTGPSGPFATYSRVHAFAVGQTVTGPSTVITFAGATLSEGLRFVISGTDLRYIGNPRILVGINAFASIQNTNAVAITLGLGLTINNVIVNSGPPVRNVGSAVPDLVKTVVAGFITEMRTNDLLGLRLLGPAVTADVNSPQLVIYPIGDGENP